MKKTIAAILIICMLFTQTVYAGDAPPTPSETAREMLGAIAAWKQGEPPPLLADEPDMQMYINMFSAVMEQLAERMSYKVYAHVTTGNTAIVVVRIGAVDIGSVAGSLLAGSAAYITFQRLMKRSVDLNGYLSTRAEALISELDTVTTLTSIHMIQGADGSWKLDISNDENLQFLNALCGGGILPYVTAIEALLEHIRS